MKFVYISIITVMLTFIGVGLFYLVISNDSNATHTSLKDADMPKLIPVSAFYADTQAAWRFQPSHDGTFIANYNSDFGKRIIEVRKRGETGLFATIKTDDIYDYQWHSLTNALLVFADGRQWQIDMANVEKDAWVDVTPRGFQNWYKVSFPSEADEPVMVLSNDRDPKVYDLYKVRQDGGGKQLLIKNEGQTLNWMLDEDFNPKIRIDRVGEAAQDIFIRDEVNTQNWRKLLSVEARDTFGFAHLSYKDGDLYAISNRNRNTTALVKIDINSGEETIVFHDPNLDIGRANMFGTYDRALDFLQYYDDYQTIVPLSKRGETFKALIDEIGDKIDLDGFKPSFDGRYVTVSLSDHERSYQYWLFDLDEGVREKISDFSFAKFADHLSETKKVTIPAADGLEIPAYLTVPKGLEAKNLPTIVLIHGGPAARVVWQYNHEKQFLANRGYAILDVNFRGSVGFGKAFEAAGYDNVGVKMQSDIMDTANWAINEGIADPDNIAVMGSSYGGYSSALAMTRDAGLFKAGISEVAVTDILYQMDNNPFAWGLYLDVMKRYFGDPENEEDRKLMRERSPITHAANASDPILLMHGKLDRRVGFEQTEEFVRALNAAEKNVSVHYFEKEGHGYERWQSRVQRARIIENFLAQHIGGRNGNFDWSELAAEYF
ncbi:MAG: S9 family peptidase [Lentilitoribacter sp.]